MSYISRKNYAALYGPTSGDRVRLEISPYDVSRGRINFRHKDERAPAFNPQRKPVYRKR